MARKHKLAAALLSLGCIQASSVWALGLGEMSLESFLNEPLKARVELLNTGDLQEDQIRVRLATTDDFDRLGVDRAYFLTGIKFEVRVNDSGQGEIVLTSDDPVLEPYLDLIIETRWPSGRLLREYTVLVDPPLFDTSTRVISATETVVETEGSADKSVKSATQTSSTGTQVDVGKKSSLAPGEMPQRNYSAGTSGSPQAGSEYMIHRDDTLWEIASAARPDGASVAQTMLDIQRLNPDAFIDGNINRIKAGYIIVLPTADQISSSLSEAVAEVKQQNEDWRAGRAPESGVSSSGPSLRISAGSEDSADNEGDAGEAAETDSTAAGQGASSESTLEDLERSKLENSELQDRLESLNSQLETLKGIVSVKDEQIAALQAALRNAGASIPDDGQDVITAGDDVDGEVDASAATATQLAENDMDAGVGSGIDAGEQTLDAPVAATPEQKSEPKPESKPKPAAKPKTTPKPQVTHPAQEPWWSEYRNALMGGLGLLIAVLGLVWWRRRSQDEDELDDELDGDLDQDVFAGVELQEDDVDLDDDDDVEEVAEATGAYGQHKHDHYASDIDAGDALAEADIYVAYGRYPQAIELLKTAVVAEPNNTAYRFRLLELCAQAGRRQEASEQLEALRDLGDPALVARGEELLASSTAPEVAAPTPAPVIPTVGNPGGVRSVISDDPPTDLELAPDFDENEGDSDDGFNELEIEGSNFDDFTDDDLELSDDFEDEVDDDDDELVFATEGSPLSTKLDLARAYIDMGDEEGARQILEEVLAEGEGEEQLQEAKALLQRLD